MRGLKEIVQNSTFVSKHTSHIRIITEQRKINKKKIFILFGPICGNFQKTFHFLASKNGKAFSSFEIKWGYFACAVNKYADHDQYMRCWHSQGYK